jgi:hypothetical protein
MTNSLSNLSVAQLKRAVEIKQRIESLEAEVGRLLGGRSSVAGGGAPARRTMSSAARARIGAAQRARWARQKRVKTKSPRKRAKVSASVRAKLASIAKARWAKAKAAGKKSL